VANNSVWFGEGKKEDVGLWLHPEEKLPHKYRDQGRGKRKCRREK